MDVYYSCGCGMTFMAIVCRSLLFCDFRNFLLALNIERHSNVTHVAWRLQVYHCCQLVLELTPWRHARFPPAILGWKILTLATRNPVIERYDLGINTLIHEFLHFSSTIILCQRIISSECICGRDVWLKGSNCLVRMVKQITIKFTETRAYNLYGLLIISHSTWWAIGMLCFPKPPAISMLMDCSSHPIDITHIPSIG